MAERGHVVVENADAAVRHHLPAIPRVRGAVDRHPAAARPVDEHRGKPREPEREHAVRSRRAGLRHLRPDVERPDRGGGLGPADPHGEVVLKVAVPVVAERLVREIDDDALPGLAGRTRRPCGTHPAAPLGRIGKRMRSQGSPCASRAVFATRNSIGCPTAFRVANAQRLPASVEGPRQIVSQGVFDRATNVPSGRTRSGSGVTAGAAGAAGATGAGATLGGAATTGEVAEARVQDTPASMPTRAYATRRRELTR